MQLYERIVSNSGRVTYKPYIHDTPAPEVLPDTQIEAEQVVTILCTLVVSMLMAISGQLLPHSRVARETKLLEQAVIRYAKLNGCKVDPSTVEVGTRAWTAAVREIQSGLQLTEAPL